MCWGAHASRRAGFGVTLKRTFLFSRSGKMNRYQQKFATARTRSPSRRIIAVHGVRNKSQAIPRRDMDTARERMRDWVERNE